MNNEIRIRKVDDELANKLCKVLEFKGITRSELLKPKIDKIVSDEYDKLPKEAK